MIVSVKRKELEMFPDMMLPALGALLFPVPRPLEGFQADYQDQICGDEIAKLAFVQQQYCFGPTESEELSIRAQEQDAAVKLGQCYATKILGSLSDFLKKISIN